MAKIELIDFTGAGHYDAEWYAADILIFTKRTRLNMSPESFREVQDMTREEKIKELEYMATTIASSWEFADLTFMISGVTRACAQQITRTRTGSYAMQSQRVTDVSEAEVVNPFAEGDFSFDSFKEASETAMQEYMGLLSEGAKPQDARGLLPMNITCNLVAKYNLRSFVDLVKARRSLRTQSEYADIIEQMVKHVTNIWPWVEPFFASANEKALDLLGEVVEEMGLETGKGTGWKVAKVMDLIRSSK